METRLRDTAVESVHSGLVASLEADCSNYREEISSLQNALRRMEAKAKSAATADDAPQKNAAKMHAQQAR